MTLMKSQQTAGNDGKLLKSMTCIIKGELSNFSSVFWICPKSMIP